MTAFMYLFFMCQGTDLPPYFVSLIQERTLFARDEPVIIRIRLGNQDDKDLKPKKFPDLIGGLEVTLDGAKLEIDPSVDHKGMFRNAISLAINAHRDFRVNLAKYFPDLRKGGEFEITYQDTFNQVKGHRFRVAPFDLPDLNQTYVVSTSMGDFSIKLNELEAPNHARNFAILAQLGFYKDMEVHRVVRKRVIQMGDPNGNGTGGSGFPLSLEVSPFLKHKKYAVGMARAEEPDSAQSQFYVCLQDLPELDQHYTVFGRVVTGEDVVEAIGNVGTSGPEGNPPDKPFEAIRLDHVRAE
ncbi:MAG: peptidylprolyl isomerase [Acidobacteria bacterium]|nr:peptidylprolyl isomerase [Acidobacteriota bacterium]